MKQKLIIITLLTTIYGCSFLATTFTKKRTISDKQTELSKNADKYFWDNFHQGNYDSIPKIVELLNSVLQESPNDFKTTLHLGFVHVWALGERQRQQNLKPDITEQIILSKKYFSEAFNMNPHDPRILGFLADMLLAEGTIFNNKKQQTEGYFKGLKAIKQWPQFNKFALGYVFSNLDKSDKNFQKGLNWQYETIDDCACKKNSKNTDYKSTIQKIKNSKDSKILRACWNTWIAPHNWEGFCLNWGDMLVKNGEVEEAIKIYNLAKESDTYKEWPFISELEYRIKNAKQNQIDFNKPIDNLNFKNQNVIMFNSKISCGGCHKMSKNEFAEFGHKNLGEENYFIKTKKK
jgi:tetratricopeptide (TPR) repeat protein